MLILVALYLSECVLWVKPWAWVFLSGRRDRWKGSPPVEGGGKGRLVFAPPLPPFGWGFVCGEQRARPGRFDVAGVRQALDDFTTATSRLRWIGRWLLAPGFFLVLPLVYWWWGASPWFWGGLAVGWGLLIAAARDYRRAHREKYPALKDERWQHTLLVALVPQHAIRAPGLLARRWLEAFHPLAVATAVLDREAFLAQAGEAWRKVVFPLPPAFPVASGPPAEATAADETAREALRTFLLANDVAPASLLAPPVPADEARAYCPRCHAQFNDLAARCPDCGGLPVVGFTPERQAP